MWRKNSIDKKKRYKLKNNGVGLIHWTTSNYSANKMPYQLNKQLTHVETVRSPVYKSALNGNLH